VKRKQRIQVTTTSQISLNLDNYFEGNVNDIDVPDDISVVASEGTTSASLFTRYTQHSASSRGTRTSSKVRRREERKRARGKKGTIYEEEYLVNSIGRLIQRVNDVRDEVLSLITALMMIDKRDEAQAIQSRFKEVVEDIRGCVTEVFAETLVSSPVSRDGVEGPAVAREVPVVDPFIGIKILV
jgi:elongator complex protein 1